MYLATVFKQSNIHKVYFIKKVLYIHIGLQYFKFFIIHISLLKCFIDK